jgi:hypothetical protein
MGWDGTDAHRGWLLLGKPGGCQEQWQPHHKGPITQSAAGPVEKRLASNIAP